MRAATGRPLFRRPLTILTTPPPQDLPFCDRAEHGLKIKREVLCGAQFVPVCMHENPVSAINIDGRGILEPMGGLILSYLRDP